MNTDSPTLYYITREIERALGMAPGPRYRIIAGKSAFAETVRAQYPEYVTLLDSPDGKPMGTGALMEHPETAKIIPPGSEVIVFKNTARIEPIAAAKGWKLINPKAALSELVENKITQVEWLGELGRRYLPTHSIIQTKRLTWTGEPFILQWGHGHTGGGTMLITSEQELKAIQAKFPHRTSRRTAYVRGPSFTVNGIVATDKILIGNISYQITGMSPFTDSVFTTVGNDWSATHSLLSEQETETIETMASDIGKKLNIAGWRGLFGIDVIRDDARGIINLIEVNARQPASTSFESFLQNENRIQGIPGLTVFEAHLKALRNEKIMEPIIPINDGAQVVQRVTKSVKSLPDKASADLTAAQYQVIGYPNADYNTDLLRIQSARGIIETHGRFNERGKEIEKIISNAPAEAPAK